MSPRDTHRGQRGEPREDASATADLAKQYEQTLATFGEKRPHKEGQIIAAFHELSERLAKKREEGFSFGDTEQAILKLKLARFFQRTDGIDINTLFDALLETPKFLQADKGGLHRLLEIHEQKTVQEIAEIRKRRAEMTGEGDLNPYESLFTTASGKFYLARLLNMPHLQEESEYMNHCVGTSTSYVNKIKRGEVEIFSLRTTPKFNTKAGKLEGDKPALTIEYDPRKKQIIQFKKHSDELITEADIAKLELFDILDQIRSTRTDVGENRDFSRIAPHELSNIKVSKYHLLTKQGEVNYKDFDVAKGEPFLKAGSMPLEGLPKVDVAKIAQIFTGLKIKPEQIAQNEDEVAAGTKLFVGQLYSDFFHKIPDTVEHIFTSFDKSEVKRDKVTIDGTKADEMEKRINKKGFEVEQTYTRKLMDKIPPRNGSEQIDLVRLTLGDLGFTKNATLKEIIAKANEYGLDICPPEVGPHYRVAYDNQPMDEYLTVAMETISGSDGRPDVFSLYRGADGVWLSFNWADPGATWVPTSKFVFRLRK